MYLAHNLLTLVHDYEYKLSSILKQHNVTYADQTLMFRKVGADYFLNHMKIQRDYIFNILSKSGKKVFKKNYFQIDKFINFFRLSILNLIYKSRFGDDKTDARITRRHGT